MGFILLFLVNILFFNDLNLGMNKLGNSMFFDLFFFRNLKFFDFIINNFIGSVFFLMYNMFFLVYLVLVFNDLLGDFFGDIGLMFFNFLGFNFCFNKFMGIILWFLYNFMNI